MAERQVARVGGAVGDWSSLPTVAVVGDSHVVRADARVLELRHELDADFVLKARGGSGINRLPCQPHSLSFDVAVVLLGGNDLASNASIASAEQLASKLVQKLHSIARVVVFCSVWGRHDISIWHRRNFNRRLQQLTEGSMNLLYHPIERNINKKKYKARDQIHLNEDGIDNLKKCIRQAARRGLELFNSQLQQSFTMD